MVLILNYGCVPVGHVFSGGRMWGGERRAKDDPCQACSGQ